MGAHDDAGSADTLPPPPPPPVVPPPPPSSPPPPQPAAIRASAPTNERSSPIETRFLTLPPPSPVVRVAKLPPERGFVAGSIEGSADARNFQGFARKAVTLEARRSG